MSLAPQIDPRHLPSHHGQPLHFVPAPHVFIVILHYPAFSASSSEHDSPVWPIADSAMGEYQNGLANVLFYRLPGARLSKEHAHQIKKGL